MNGQLIKKSSYPPPPSSIWEGIIEITLVNGVANSQRIPIFLFPWQTEVQRHTGQCTMQRFWWCQIDVLTETG